MGPRVRVRVRSDPACSALPLGVLEDITTMPLLLPWLLPALCP